MDVQQHEQLMLAIEDAIDGLTEKGLTEITVDVDDTPINIAGRYDGDGLIILEIYGAWNWE